jgi:hypothetical protein
MSSADSEDLTMADASTVHEEKKPAGKLATLWGKLGLDAGTLMMMAKYVNSILIPERERERENEILTA